MSRALAGSTRHRATRRRRPRTDPSPPSATRAHGRRFTGSLLGVEADRHARLDRRPKRAEIVGEIVGGQVRTERGHAAADIHTDRRRRQRLPHRDNRANRCTLAVVHIGHDGDTVDPRQRADIAQRRAGSGMGAAQVSEPDRTASICAELTSTAAVELRCLISGQLIGMGGRSLTPSFSEVFIGHP